MLCVPSGRIPPNLMSRSVHCTLNLMKGYHLKCSCPSIRPYPRLAAVTPPTTLLKGCATLIKMAMALSPQQSFATCSLLSERSSVMMRWSSCCKVRRTPRATSTMRTLCTLLCRAEVRPVPVRPVPVRPVPVRPVPVRPVPVRPVPVRPVPVRPTPTTDIVFARMYLCFLYN